MARDDFDVEPSGPVRWSPMSGREPVARPTLVRQLASLGVQRGGVLLVHAAFRAVGPVEGGIDGLIDSLQEAVGPDGTLVMPSWGGERDEVFDPVRTEPHADLGAVPRVFWRRPGVRRSEHLQAFAAIGPRAVEVLRDPLPLPPHIPESPVGRVHDLDGQVLLLGVSHDANTTIHLAELIAEVPYRVSKSCTVLRDGTPTRVDYGENDHCCRRFLLVDDWLGEAGLQSTGPVGHATARLVRSRDVVEVVTRALADEPLLFLHAAEEACEECDEARASVRPT